MNKQITAATLVIGLLSLGVTPVLADHYHGHSNSGYGAGKGMASTAMYGPYGCAKRSHGHGKVYGKGHPNRGWKDCHRGAYCDPYQRGWSKGHGHPYRYGRAMHPHGHKHYGAAGGYFAPMKPETPAATLQQAPASAPAYEPAAPVVEASPQTIVNVAVAAEQFGTLLSAVQAADLVDTLNAEGPFTVFAPTDEAFGKLPEGTVAGLLKDKDALTRILTYHVVAGRLEASDLLEQGSFETVNGATLELGQLDVAKSDISASNGVIHVIDQVLMPPSS